MGQLYEVFCQKPQIKDVFLACSSPATTLQYKDSYRSSKLSLNAACSLFFCVLSPFIILLKTNKSTSSKIALFYNLFSSNNTHCTLFAQFHRNNNFDVLGVKNVVLFSAGFL